MNFTVLQFPGSNCDQDVVHVLRHVLGHSARLLWHKEHSLGETDAVIGYKISLALARHIGSRLRDWMTGKPQVEAL